MSELQSDKLEKGQLNLKYWTQYLTVSMFLAFLTGVAYLVKKDGLTFDSQGQKQKVIEQAEKPVYMNSQQRERVLYHVDDENVHMSFQEKRTLIIIEERQKAIEENQIKIGQDLQEIKGLLRRSQ